MKDPNEDEPGIFSELKGGLYNWRKVSDEESGRQQVRDYLKPCRPWVLFF